MYYLDMPSIVGKRQGGKTYYYLVESARVDGQWFILDNRFSQLLEPAQARSFLPIFAINHTGVKLFAAPYAQNRVRQNLEFSDSQPRDVITGSGEETLSLGIPGLPLNL